MRPTDTVKEGFKLPFKGLAWGAKLIINGRLLKKHSGAAFAKPAELKAWLNASNAGLLIDGDRLRLSETDSVQNVCVIAGIGAGKTSRYVIPNVLDRAARDCSIVVNDPKGEVLAATGHALKSNGFDIIVLDPERPERSHRFNPLLEARDDVELEQMAEVIIRAGNPHDKDPFWNNGAVRMAGVLLRSMRNAARHQKRNLLTLANLALLFKAFGQNGRALEPFMLEATVNPDNPRDPRLWQDWVGCLTGNPDGVSSFALNGVNATRAMSNPNLAWMTAKSDFKVENLRSRKTALFIVTPAQQADYYAFLVSLVTRAVLNGLMKPPSLKGLRPVYMLLDEFATMTIPGFVATANTIRAYNVSLSIVLQSIAQLNARYGADMAHAIAGGFKTLMTYPGSDLETTLHFERLIGKVRERERTSLSPDATTHYREYNLISSGEVRTLPKNKALVVSLNRNPALITTSPYFANWRFKRKANRPFELPARAVALNELDHVRL